MNRRSFSAEEIALMLRLHRNGKSFAAIAKRFACSGETVSRHIRRADLTFDEPSPRAPDPEHREYLVRLYFNAMDRVAARAQEFA